LGKVGEYSSDASRAKVLPKPIITFRNGNGHHM
jgi:hypothetical protein